MVKTIIPVRSIDGFHTKYCKILVDCISHIVFLTITHIVFHIYKGELNNRTRFLALTD